MPADLSPVDFATVTAADIERVSVEAMRQADAAIAAIVAIPEGQRTFANTLLALETALEPVFLASGAYAFLGYVAADHAVREAGRAADAALDQYIVQVGFREDLYAAIRAFAATPQATALTGEDARLLAFELRDYRRNGFGLPPEQRARLQAMFERLTALGVAFRTAIDDWDDGIVVDREGLDGLPASFVASLQQVADGRYRVTLDYPQLHPFLGHAKSRALRQELFEKDQRKGGEANVARLEEALALRAEAAALLGYDSWAAYAVEPRMAQRRTAVDEFLAGLIPQVQVLAARDMAALRDAMRRETGSGDLQIWDWRYYHNRLLERDYAIDDFAVAAYFPLEAAISGLFAVTGALFGIRYEPAREAPVWHPDVRAFDVFDATGTEPLARFYMDLHPRPNKFGHAAAFTLRRGRELPDGSYQRPISAIVANFTAPSDGQPSLLRHAEVVVLWHEFGHILHQVLTRAKRSRFSGTATERDFVEAPSQMLEHWCWDPAVLGSWARHSETGEAIPPDLVRRMVGARNLDAGVMTLRQLYFAALDWRYHSPGFDGDTTSATAALHHMTGFPYTPGTYFQAGFGHLFGYDAGYYGYLWSHVYGDDMYTRFEAAGPLDATMGAHYRRTILERGGSVDGGQLVRDFLGRDPDNRAFLRHLGLSG